MFYTVRVALETTFVSLDLISAGEYIFVSHGMISLNSTFVAHSLISTGAYICTVSPGGL
jgi:hypothetical protein